jgi:O-antigen/teichoic acid export membrane protein
MLVLNNFRRKLFHIMGIDRAVFFAISSKVWSMGAGLITTMMIANFFSAEIQGYYYTFISVLALQVFAELGLGVVISANASHEWAKLSLSPLGKVEGDADAKSRLTSLGRFAMRWYVIAGCIVTLGLTVGGFLFFGAKGGQSVSTWGAPWVVLCIVTGINLCCMPIWALLEGCNQVSNVYIYRFIQSVATGFAAWIAIYLGAELWVASIVGVVVMLVLMMTAGRNYTTFIKEIMLSKPTGLQVNWHKDILPMQWRISLSWLSGYFTFSLFTPVLFHYQGALVAGQMGMTWSLISALTSIASSWVAPKAPIFAILIAQQKYTELDKIFWRLTAIVISVSALGALTIWLMVYTLSVMQHPYALRLLSPTATAYLLLSTVLVASSLPMSTYLRAHKTEPLFLLSIASGVINGVVIIFTGRYYSADGMALGYLVITLLIIPFVYITWNRCRMTWHMLP